MIKRRTSRKIWVGNIPVGGGSAIPVQSMIKVPATDVKRAVAQVRELEAAGCVIVRAAVPDEESAQALAEIKKRIKIPLVADIHFNYRFALAAIESGADKIRLNPGNIRRQEEIKAVVGAAKRRGIPIRVGVNSGSLNTVRRPTSDVRRENLAHRMAGAALDYVRIIEKLKFRDIVISLKTPDICSTVESYRLIAGKVDYPLHLGMTATGPLIPAIVKSSLGIGILLLEGIGDTIRVSLTGDPVEEVKAGREVLQATGLSGGVEIISCPTCGRCRVNLPRIVHRFQNALHLTPNTLHGSLRVAIMGCEVNGPGEAKEADIGLAFGGRNALLFRKGRILRKVKEGEAVSALLSELSNYPFKRRFS
ncbi:4-hydroxy-3-methylbut-2-en-1-yl diphosphate synthase [Candidatus Desantisbacteria bacterium CG02_land_8_20_14_3_00_49_13]|nr:MAG: 4-hydroxy-3-methylbut-2-en-1-yl diphosphate synthase [Candidatus Desantisbacteria bacterium CG02_land_8_20_14_3_00_49_13]